MVSARPHRESPKVLYLGRRVTSAMWFRPVLLKHATRVACTSPGRLVKMQVLTPYVQDGAWPSAFLTSSGAMLILLVPGAHLKWLYFNSRWTNEGRDWRQENHQSRHRGVENGLFKKAVASPVSFGNETLSALAMSSSVFLPLRTGQT